MLQIGNIAPDFRLEDENGKWVTLGSLLNDGAVVLVFYPGDFTPVCTKQLCSYRDVYGQFLSLGIRMVGISHNPPSEHQAFKQRYKFEFPLLSDTDRKITRKYEVTSLLMFGGTSRAVFIISRDMKVLYRHVEPTTLSHRRPDELLEAIQMLRAQKAM
jgi:peroxiredoxin Q/BCP